MNIPSELTWNWGFRGLLCFFEEPETEQLKAGFQTGFPHCSVTQGRPWCKSHWFVFGMDE